MAFLSRTKWPAVTMGLTLGVVLGATGLLSTALAVHDPADPFELDGNPTQTTADDDWDNVFNLSTPYTTPRGTPDPGGGETFVADGNNLPGGKETTAWKGSNKDIDTIDTWQYESSKVTPDKDNITNAYAKAYTVGGFPASDLPGHPAVVHEHLIIYFGADRFANAGDAALGFWFFKGDVGLDDNNAFSGAHQVGDVLVQVDFVAGGRSSEIQIFTWVGSGGDFGALEEILPPTSANGFTVCDANDRACATTNNTATASPWAYTPKSGTSGTFPAESFFEAGIDVTALVGQVCFSSFMAETRSSHSETAELKDFALGDFDLCSINVEKVCFSDNGTTSPVFNPTTETYTTKHTVTINNDGFGPIFDVALRDNAVTSTKVCSIRSITGGGTGMTTVPAGGILFPNATTFQPIASGLAAGNSITVNLVCITDDNPFVNSVTVRSSATTGGTADVVDTDAEQASVAADGLAGCTKELFAGLKLLKFCQGDPGTAQEPNTQYQAGDLSVVLNPANGYKPRVCVDIALSNTTSSQRMVIDAFSDSDLGSLMPVGGIELAPMGTTGDTYNVSRCYDPAAPDGNATNPALAQYTDEVSANGHGKTQPIPATATPKTATCKLCPTCPDCPAPD